MTDVTNTGVPSHITPHENAVMWMAKICQDIYDERGRVSGVMIPGTLILLQGVAAFLALRLVGVTGERTWVVMAIAMTLMVLRHGLACFDLLPEHDAGFLLALSDEAIELAASLCMVIGIAWMGPRLQRLKQAERALQEREDQFLNLAEGSVEGVIIHRDFKPLFVNQTWATMHGYATEEVLAMDSTLDFIVPEDRARILSYKDACLRGETVPAYHEYQSVRRDGSRIWLANGVMMISWQGEPAMQVTSYDITERKQAEMALQESEELYRTLIEQAGDGIMISDAQRQYMEVNPSACDMLGYSREELLRMHVGDTIAPESLKALPIRLRALYRGETVIGQRWLTRKDGTVFPVEFSAKILSDKRLLCIVRDNTERYRLEAQLRQSQKMEAIGTLAGGIAHEFNNILSSILGFSDLAKCEASPGTAIWNYVEQVGIAGLRAKDLVQQILAFSRHGDTEREPIQIDQIIRESLQLLRATLPATIEMQQELATAGKVLGNPTQIHQIVMNLCSNAEHAMRERGGRLVLRLDTVEITDAFVPFLNDLQPGSYMRLTVQDTGHGIPPDVQEHIFEPFFTTKEAGQGTGLGLATVHGIVRDYGGAITVESAVGEGATFAVYLPRLPDVEPLRDDIIEGEDPRGQERILVVDDDPMLTEMLHTQLQSLGYEVQSSSSSRAALEIFQASPEHFDLVITDQTMPEMTGEHLTLALRQCRPHIPIILCTGFSHVITAEKAREIGVDAFCMKPVTRQELSRTIRQVFARRAAMSSTVDGGMDTGAFPEPLPRCAARGASLRSQSDPRRRGD